jgi:acyl-coenzyme A thioesterase 13
MRRSGSGGLQTLTNIRWQVEITRVASGIVEAEVRVSPTLMNSKNILHGSTSATIVDWIGGLVIASTHPARRSNRGVSVDIHVSYLGPARKDDMLLIRASTSKVGRSLAFINVHIYARAPAAPADGSQDRPVCSGSHTKYVG